MPHIPMHMRTGQHPTIQQNFGLAQADVLLYTDFILFFLMVTKLDMVELFNTIGESGNQQSGGRNGKRNRFMCRLAQGNLLRAKIVSTGAQVGCIEF